MTRSHLPSSLTSPSPPIVIAVNRVSLRHDGVTVLDDVTLAVPRGAVVGLVGRNGAGKTSLMQCLVGLTAPDAGDASLLGCPSLTLTDAVRERLGYVSQAPDLFEWMEVHEHLRAIGRAYPRWSEDRMLRLASRLELPLGRSVRELSFGNQQKLAVVLALAHDPDVLVLDEPVASLDPATRRAFMQALFTGNDDRTILISSHLLGDLERVVSHVAFMRHGRVQLFDAWDALLEHLRLVPEPAATVPPEALICENGAEPGCVIDTRKAPGRASAGRSLSLDDLFVALNS